VLGEIEENAAETSSPLERLERLLHPWSSFLVIPIFALANAGVDLSGAVVGDAVDSTVAAGIMLGLLVGKPTGVFGATFLAVRLKLGELPPAVSWVHVGGLGLLAGIGFTVALFITGLAFQNPGLTDEAKIAVLASSTIAGVAGFLFLRLTSQSGSAWPFPTTRSH